MLEPISNSVLFLTSLLAFTALVISIITLILIGIRSQLKAAEHRMFFGFLLNYALVCTEDIIRFTLQLAENDTLEPPILVSWHAFGPFIFLYVYYTLYPQEVTRRQPWWNLLLVIPFLEYLSNVPANLHHWGYLLDNNPMVKAYKWFDSWTLAYSFPSFAVFVVLSLLFVFRNHFFRRLQLMYRIPLKWFIGLLLFLLAFVLEILFGKYSDAFSVMLYSTVLGFSIYLLLFFIFNTQMFNASRDSYNDRLKEVFTSTQGTILLNEEQYIMYINRQWTSLTHYAQHQLLGKPIAQLIPSFSQLTPNTTPSKLRQPQTTEFECLTRQQILIRCRCEVEYLPSPERATHGQYIIRLISATEIGQQIKPKDQALLQRLKRLMEEEQVFLNPQLQQSDVATRLDISKRKLGELMNMHDKGSFPLYINAYRVRYAQQLLENRSQNQSISAIGVAAGFSSKSSFYTVFREFTGQTPGQYRKRVAE